MIETSLHYYEEGGIIAELVKMPYRIIEGEQNDYSDDIAICNSCNKVLDKNHGNWIGHTLIDCFQEIYRKLKEYE